MSPCLCAIHHRVLSFSLFKCHLNSESFHHYCHHLYLEILLCFCFKKTLHNWCPCACVALLHVSQSKYRQNDLFKMPIWMWHHAFRARPKLLAIMCWIIKALISTYLPLQLISHGPASFHNLTLSQTELFAHFLSLPCALLCIFAHATLSTKSKLVSSSCYSSFAEIKSLLFKIKMDYQLFC